MTTEDVPVGWSASVLRSAAHAAVLPLMTRLELAEMPVAIDPTPSRCLPARME